MLQHLINLIKKVVQNTEINTTTTNKTSVNTATTKNNRQQRAATVDKTQRINALLGNLYLFANGTPPKNWSPSRFLYKVGIVQLQGITEQLMTIAKNETELLKKDTFRYSLIWALGRCGDASILPLLETLVKTNEKEYIKRLTLDVYLKVANDTAKKELLTTITNLIPADALDQLRKTEVSSLHQDQIKINVTT